MEHLRGFISFLQVIILLGAGARVIYCVSVMHMDTDNERSYKIRIRNVLVFAAVAETISGLLKIVASYF